MTETEKKKAMTFTGIALFVIIADQWTKYAVRTTPDLQQWVIIEDWLRFFYTQNPGMALGIDILPTQVIGVISTLAATFIIYLLVRFLPHSNWGQILCMGLITGGAIGNIIDRMFMGFIEGNGGFMDGHVVDFIHFYLEIGDFDVFPYIFNVADVAISTAVIAGLVFYKKLIPTEEELQTIKAEREAGKDKNS